MKWVEENLIKLRNKKPLVHNITNLVVMNVTANALLSIGASPVMAHASEELEDMLTIADALVINIGTLDERWIHSIKKAIKISNKLDRPIILDPVGAGATSYRTNTAKELLEMGNISVVRGNFSEIKALLGKGETRGVDSVGYNKEIAKDITIHASEKLDTVVALTGPIDYVSDGNRLYEIENGTPLLGRVTGTGCMVTALIGAFLAVTEPIKAAVSGLVIFEIAAEKAEEEAPYPGSFHVKLYDWLYRIDSSLIKSRKRVSEYVLGE